MNNTAYNAYHSALKQFDKAADILDLNIGSREFLRTPMKEQHFTIPIKTDEGSVKVFKAFRILHNNASGPGLGGIRFHPMETADTARALAM